MVLAVAAASGCVPQSGGGAEGGGGGFSIVSFAPFILIFVLFYFLILRPQQKQSKLKQEMLASLKRGDKIVNSGGILGTVLSVEDDQLTVEIDKGVSVKMLRNGISAVVDRKEEEKK